MLLSMISGFTAGILHVISGPDHLAAVAPFAIAKKKKTWMTGLFWGLGHTGGVWIVGVFAFILREVLPIDLISSWSERLVGFTLIGVGLWGLRRAFKTKLHIHEHAHENSAHSHVHLHVDSTEHNKNKKHQHSHAPLGIGILHGLAGSSHLYGVLPALLLPTKTAALVYIVSYGVGSIAAMSIFSYLIGFFSTFFAKTPKAYNLLLTGFAVIAIGIGIVWISIS